MVYAKELENIVRDISFPRHAGTEGDERVREILAEKCKVYKLPCTEEKFKASNSFMHKFNNIPYFAWGILILAFTLVNILSGSHLASLIFAALLLAGSFCIDGFIRALKYPVMYFSKNQYETGNIIIGDDKRKGNARMNIVVVAHTDSKSETPNPHVLMTIIGVSVIFGTWIYAVHVIIYSIIGLVSPALTLHTPYWFSYGFLLAGIDMVRIVTRYGNESAGACDDGTGVAITLLLMRELESEKLEHVNVIGLLAGAEEVGEVGTHQYIKKREKDINKEDNHFLVIDGIMSKSIIYGTSRGFLARPFSKPLLRSLKSLLDKEKPFLKKLEFKPQWFPPPVNTDHSAVVKHGFPALVLASIENISHGKEDVPDNMDFNSISSFMEFLIAFIHQVDDDLRGERA